MVAKMVKMMMAALLIFGGSLYAAGDGAGSGGGQQRGRDVAAMAVAQGYVASASDGDGEDNDVSDDRSPKKNKKQIHEMDDKEILRCKFAGTPEAKKTCNKVFDTDKELMIHEGILHKSMIYPDIMSEELEKFGRREAVRCRYCQKQHRTARTLQIHIKNECKLIIRNSPSMEGIIPVVEGSDPKGGGGLSSSSSSSTTSATIGTVGVYVDSNSDTRVAISSSSKSTIPEGIPYAAGDGVGGGGGHKRGRDEVAAAAFVAQGHGVSASDDGGDRGDDGSDDRSPKKKKRTLKTVSKDKRCPRAGEGDERCQQKFSEIGLRSHQSRIHKDIMIYRDVNPEELEKFNRGEKVPCRECIPATDTIKIGPRGYDRGFFNTARYLQNHRDDYHPKEKHEYQCETCTFSWKMKKSLTAHLNSTGHRRRGLSSSSSSSTTSAILASAATYAGSSHDVSAGVPSSSMHNLYNAPSVPTTDNDDWMDNVFKDDQ